MNAIKQLHDKLRDLTILAGVPKEQYDGLFDLVVSNVPDDSWLKQEIFDAYSALEAGSWREARRIRELLPESVWIMYKHLPEMLDARESRALKKQLAKLKTNYYSVFKEIRRVLRKKKKAPEPDLVEESLEEVLDRSFQAWPVGRNSGHR